MHLIQGKNQKVFKNSYKRIFFLGFLVFELLGASFCNPFHSRLEDLGDHNSYDDVSIPEDFTYDFEKISVKADNPSSRYMYQASQSASKQNPEENYDVTFKVENGIYRLAYNNALRWNGCYMEQEARGGHGTNANCGLAFLHQRFHSALEEHFFKCIQSSAMNAGYPRPTKVFINHWGTYSNRRVRNTRRLSLHARARAIDIVYFDIFDNNGRRYRISTFKRHYKGKQAVFYDEFRYCWRDSLPRKCAIDRGSEFVGSIGHPKSKLGGDSRHNDHLHLSLPLCAGA